MGLFILLGAALLVVMTFVMIAIVIVARTPPRKSYGWAMGRGLPLDPGALNLVFEERELKLSDGQTTLGWIIEGRNPDGPVIVATHGWSDSKYVTLATIGPILAKLASRVIMHDMRGHGEARAKVFTGSATEATDLVHIIDQLALPEGDRPLVLWGHCMGGGVSIRATAQTLGDRVAGVVWEGSFPDWLPPLRNLLWRWRVPAEPFATLGRLLQPVVMPAMNDFNLAQWTARCDRPILLVHAEDDWLCTIDNARRIEAAAKDVEMVTFETGDHLHVVQENAPAYEAALQSFLDRIGSASTSSTPSMVGPSPALAE